MVAAGEEVEMLSENWDLLFHKRSCSILRAVIRKDIPTPEHLHDLAFIPFLVKPPQMPASVVSPPFLGDGTMALAKPAVLPRPPRLRLVVLSGHSSAWAAGLRGAWQGTLGQRSLLGQISAAPGK